MLFLILKPRLPAAIAAALAFLSASVTFAQSPLLIDYDTGRTVSGALGSRGSGQTFTPRDAAGAAGAASLALTSFSVWRGGGGTGSSIVSPHTWLVIYDRDPNDPAAVQLGASSGSLAIGIGDSPGTQYTWSFDRVMLPAGTACHAVFSSAPVDNNLPETNPATTRVQMSLQTLSDADNYPGGVCLIAGRVPHENGNRDLRFVAAFAAVPPPPTLEITGFSPAEVLLDAAGLDPLKSYQVRRGPALSGFPDFVDAPVTGASTHQFKDLNPPAGRAFYFLEELLP